MCVEFVFGLLIGYIVLNEYFVMKLEKELCELREKINTTNLKK